MKPLAALCLSLFLTTLLYVIYLSVTRQNPLISPPPAPSSPVLIFHSSPISSNFLTIGEINPPAAWKYWQVSLPSYELSPLPADHPYFNSFRDYTRQLSRTHNFNFAKALKLDSRVTVTPLPNALSSDRSSYLVSAVNYSGQTQLWVFSTATLQLSPLTTIPPTACKGRLADWDESGSSLMFFASRPSALDSSSDDISQICIYNYATKSVSLRQNIPVTRRSSFSYAYGSLRQGWVILAGNNTVLVFHTSTRKFRDLSGYALAEGFLETVGSGLLPLQPGGKPSTSYPVYFFDLALDKLLPPVYFDRLPAKPGVYQDYLKIVGQSTPSGQIMFEYTQYKPYSNCWYLVTGLKTKTKVLCSADLYARYYPNDLPGNLRTVFEGWFPAD